MSSEDAAADRIRELWTANEKLRREIEAHRRAERALAESETRFARVLQAKYRELMHPGSLRCSSLAYRSGYAAFLAPCDPGASALSPSTCFRFGRYRPLEPA